MKKISFISLLFIVMIHSLCSYRISEAKEEKIRFRDTDIITINKGEKKTLSVVGKNDKKIKVKWSSANSKVVKVSKKGRIKGIKTGCTKITAYSAKRKKKIKCTVYVGKKVKAITLNKRIYQMEKGSKLTLKPKVAPKKAAYAKLAYQSDNAKVAAVSKKGVVKAKKVGTCNIIVSSKDGTQKEVRVLIDVKPVSIKRISFAKSEITLEPGESIVQKAVVSPKKAANKKIRYVCSDSSVATVTNGAKVTGKSVGDATIIATTNDGSQLFASYVVHVKESAENMRLSKSKLKIVSVYGDDNAYHPSVQNFARPWNGYKYWMAYTPFPNANDRMENPHITVSNDMIHWTVPNDFSNPLDPAGGIMLPAKQYNSDTELVYRSDTDTLECWWRRVDKATGSNSIYRRTTKDGVHWTEAELVLKESFSKDGLLSPAVVWEDGVYKMWTIDYHKNFPVCYRQSRDGVNWENPRQIVIPYTNKALKNWHLDVIHTSKGYEMLVVAFDKSREKMSCYYTGSKDNQQYTTAIAVLEPSTNEKAWDNKGLYRTSFFVENGKYNVFYSGIGKNGGRGIGLSRGSAITSLRGYGW